MTDIKCAIATLTIAEKWALDADSAKTEKKIWSWPNHSEGIQQWCKIWYINALEWWTREEQYYLSEEWKAFVKRVLDLL